MTEPHVHLWVPSPVVGEDLRCQRPLPDGTLCPVLRRYDPMPSGLVAAGWQINASTLLRVAISRDLFKEAAVGEYDIVLETTRADEVGELFLAIGRALVDRSAWAG